MKERYELAYNRIHEIVSEKNIPEVYRAYCQETAVLLSSLDQVLVLAEGDGAAGGVPGTAENMEYPVL